MKELFNLIDEDGSGAIDKPEMRKFLSTLPGVDEARTIQILALADEDGSGEIEFEEFIEVLNEACREIPTDELMQLFQEETEKRRAELNRKKSMFEAKPEKEVTLIRRSGKSMRQASPPPTGNNNDEKLKELEKQLEEARKRAEEAEAKEREERERAEREKAEQERLREQMERERKAREEAEAKAKADADAAKAAKEAEEAKKALQRQESENRRLKEQLAARNSDGDKHDHGQCGADCATCSAAQDEAARLRYQLEAAKRELKDMQKQQASTASRRQNTSTHRPVSSGPQFGDLENETNLSKILHGGGHSPHRYRSGSPVGTSLYTPSSPSGSGAVVASGSPSSGGIPKPGLGWRPRPPQYSKHQLSYCMGCGLANRCNITPYLVPRRRQTQTHEVMTEFYCRPCKKVVVRQVRSSPPKESELTYANSGDVYWICKTCGAREMAGRPANTRVNGVCNRCRNQTEFISRGSWERLPAPTRASTDRVLFCMGCDEEEWAMAWEQDLHVVELYCYKCCGDTAWQVRRRNWLSLRPPYCDMPDAGRYLSK
eukprot:TRINITY_DN32670_c0_g1_i1.p1 TRINITY_DN32670_c0_g1~~TRINITY_DN32670_c0_g1_i1.p1  ORF type:complete len:579 (+),score=74.66 TRINITY_DN32670_c0_g1_i1:102-1739(+)